MTKEHLTVEFRYRDINSPFDGHASRKITIGIYDTLEDAILKGNETLGVIYETLNATNREFFKLNGGFMGHTSRLVAEMINRIDVYAKITSLSYGNLTEVLDDVFETNSQYYDHIKEIEG